MQTIVYITLIILYSVSILGLTFVILLENRNPLKTIPWVLVLLFLPGIGIIFYVFFGQDNRRRRVISRRTYKRIIMPLMSGHLMQDKCIVSPAYQPLSHLLNYNNQTPLLYGSNIVYYTNGRDKFNALIEEIEKAVHHIHLQYYIFSNDEIGRKVQQLLIKKAKENIKVRILYDDVGSWNVKEQFFKEMKAAGIEVYSFLRVVFPIFTSKVNYRNHRKIVVIDGKVGFMGGMNIADRYINGTSWGTWRDTHFKITGKGVHGLQSSFLIDWYVVSKQLIKEICYYPRDHLFSENMMQIVTSGPNGQWRTLQQAFMFCITNAKKYLYIQTPYFLPTESLNQALQTAALGGVEVCLMLPERSDTRMAHIASHSFLDDMIKAGVTIFFYKTGFLHSKILVMDDELTCIGSANFDFRSFEHNFEINAFVYERSFALKIKKMFLDDIVDCEQVNATCWLNRPIITRLSESVMRLFSPLL